MLAVATPLEILAANSEVVYYDTQIKANNLGGYEFDVEAHEMPSNEVLPIVGKEYFPVTSAKFLTEVDNTAPGAVYSAKPVTKVDVVFAIGDYEKTEELLKQMSTLEALLNTASNNVDARVQEIKSSFSSEFALHTTWDTYSDMDTHIRLYDKNGRQLEYIWYRNRVGTALTLDKDDTTGSNSKYENYTEYAGVEDGEWFTIDFPNLPANAVRMDISIVAYRGTSTTTVTLVDKMSNQIITKSKVKLTSSKQEIQIGRLQKNNGTWDFIKANGEVFKGSNVIPLGETLQDASWRDNAVKFIVNITDEIQDETKDVTSEDFQYTVSKLIDTNAYLINIGNNTNMAYMQRFLDALTRLDGDEPGTFIDDTGVSAVISKTSEWILNKVRKYDKPVDWILVNTEVIWETKYTDYEKDLPLNFGEHDGTKNSDDSDITLGTAWGVGVTHLYTADKILAERWRFRHYNNFYDNSPIQESFHYIWMSDPVEIFPNPGKYRINYKRKDNPFHTDVNPTHPFDEYRRWSTNYDRVEVLP